MKFTKPRVLLTPDVLGRLQAYAALAEGEVSGLGKVEQTPTGDLVVVDVALLRQESDSAGTRIPEDAVAEFVNALLDRGESPKAWRCWWHSHGAYGVFWSGTDEATCTTMGHDWMVSIVINRRGDLLARLDVYHPVHMVASLKVGTHVELADDLLATIEAEVRVKVKKPPRSQDWWWEREESLDRGQSWPDSYRWRGQGLQGGRPG